MITSIKISCKRYIEIILGARNNPDSEEAETVKQWLSDATCPNKKCKAKGQFNNHGYYTRGFIDLMSPNGMECGAVMILRGKCKSCGTTHAFQPEDIIPYKSLLVLSFLILILTYFPEQQDPTSSETKSQSPDEAHPEAESGDQKAEISGIKAEELRSYEPVLQRSTLLKCEDYERPCSIRMMYQHLQRFKYFQPMLQDVLRNLNLWQQERQPDIYEIAHIILDGNFRPAQQRTLELHRMPMFFQRKRTKTGIPHMGMLLAG